MGLADPAPGDPTGERLCCVGRFLDDPESYGLTADDRDWLAAQLAAKTEHPATRKASFSYVELSRRFAAETGRAGKRATLSSTAMSIHARGLCPCQTG